MSESLDIDLKQLEKAESEEQIVSIVNNWHGNDINRKQERAAGWSQALHYAAGDQWIRYNQREHRWEAIPYTDANKNIERPVTNHFLRWIVVNSSGFTSRPEMVVDANSDEPADKTAAKIADVVLDYLWEDLDKDDLYYEAALWALLTGIVFRKSYKQHTRDYVELPALKGDKEVIIKQYIRKLMTEIVSPFNMAFEGLAKRWRDVSVVMESTARSIDFIKDQYDVDAPGYTGKAKDVKEEMIVSSPLALYEGIKNIIEGYNSSNYGTRTGGSELKNTAILKQIYVNPCKKYPEGRLIVTASNVLLYDSKSPYYYLDGKFWHPYTAYSFNKLPGSIWGISLAQQLIPIQRRINAIDALIAYNRKTVAVGTWLIPNESNIPDEQMIGIPGQNVNYDTSPTGARPEKIPGTPLPAQVIQERQLLLGDGERLAYAADIRSGDNPEGVKTVGQLQIIMEQTEQSRSKQVESWEKFIERSEQLDLLNFQDVYQIPNPKVNNQFKKFSKDITSFDWNKFIGTDIRDNATVRVGRGSTVRTSKLLRQNVILTLAKGGLLGDIMADPFLHKKFLEEFGLTMMFSENNIDIKMAEKAIEMMKDGEYPPVLDIHNPDIQLMVLVRYMKDPKYLELEDRIKRLFEKRKIEYIDMLAEQPVEATNILPQPGQKMPGMGGAGGQGQGLQNLAENASTVGI